MLKTYAYDGLHRRVRETADGTTTDLYYSDAWQVLEERVTSGGTSVPRVQYVWSPVYVDALVLRDRDTTGDGSLDERLWVVQDANYNVTALFDNSGNVVERYAYDPFGQVTVLDAGWGERAASVFAWLYLHQGGRFDVTSGLYYFRHRDYSPTLGRWIRNDPIGLRPDLNLYRYMTNSPPNGIDPLGLERPGFLPSYNWDGTPWTRPPKPPSTLQKFLTWYNFNITNTAWTKDLPACPCFLPKEEWTTTRTVLSKGDPVTISTTHSRFVNPDPDVWDGPDSRNFWWQRNTLLFTFYHPGAKYELTSKPKVPGGPRQQCTYDANGKLIPHGSGAATADRGSTFSGHLSDDMDPYDWVLELDGGTPGTYVNMYFDCCPFDSKNNCKKNP